MQVGIISPNLFNVVVDNLVLTYLALTVEYQTVVHLGLGLNVGRCLGVFYANNSMSGARNPEWLQNALNVIISLFQWCRLFANVAKYWTVTYQNGAL